MLVASSECLCIAKIVSQFSFSEKIIPTFQKNTMFCTKKIHNCSFSNILKIYTIFALRILYFVWNSFTSHIANRAETQFCWNDVQLQDSSFNTCANLRKPLMHLVKLTDKVINWMLSLYVQLASFFTYFIMV